MLFSLLRLDLYQRLSALTRRVFQFVAIHVRLGERRFAHGISRPHHPKQDEGVMETFKKTPPEQNLWAILGSGRAPSV